MSAGKGRNPVKASKYDEKIAALKIKAKREADAPRSIPSLLRIAKYWATKPETFTKFNWDTPGCFACGYYGRANDDESTLDSQWSRCGLERCHLVAHAEGGSVKVSNLVLLCQRCHRDAPMIGVSPQPMIDWINRRKNYLHWVAERIAEECAAVSPTLPQDFATLGLTSDETQAGLTAMAKVLRVGYHTQGDMIASAVQCLYALVQYHLQMRRALRSSG